MISVSNNNINKEVRKFTVVGDGVRGEGMEREMGDGGRDGEGDGGRDGEGDGGRDGERDGGRDGEGDGGTDGEWNGGIVLEDVRTNLGKYVVHSPFSLISVA
ncbi:hypothetical protein Pcinc_044511 [Petrolisthes cinctipes]|uniref:Uncharacterized protein n=1 Tax=Petrolisthes cinctipes TaxID=88211 RepID=A0AAE1EU23_PETCI|nr:hypothetical protein Pcinc_044511 [Petrolisthes cinctipes]